MKFDEKILVWILLPVALFLLFKSSEEPLLIESSRPIFKQFANGNTIIFNICIGYIVSLLFYILVVFIPENRRNRELKAKLGQPISFVFEAFSSGIFHWSKHVIHCKPIDEHIKVIDQFLKQANFKSLGEPRAIVILQSADEILPTFEQLVPVAFQISHEHAMIWLSLTNSIRQLSRLWHDKSDERDYGVLDLNLKEFVEYVEQFYATKS
ncbi:hypothetical protein ACGTN6_16975 [Halomonas sp. THAF12]|uniref:hypothetical protein n=1 Tax=Halomonas sp. B23F22_10 TaxID=3459515 RepID=UPI00373E7EC8